MRNGILVCTAAAMLLLSAGTVYGGGVAGSWGLGTFLDYNRSIFKLKDWYETGRGQAGVVFTYVMSPRTSVEMEFHRSIFENGALEDRAFTWPIDGRDYKSPDAVSEMRHQQLSGERGGQTGRRRHPGQGEVFHLRDRRRGLLRLHDRRKRPDLSGAARGPS